MSTKLSHPITITIEDQETLNLFAALTGSVGIKTLLEYGVNPVETLALFSMLDNLSSVDNPPMIIVKKDMEKE